MHTFPVILLIFLIGCRGEYDTAEFIWEQKTDTTKTVLNEVLNKKWIEKKGNEFMNQAKQFYKDKLYKEEENKVGKEQKTETH